MMRAGWPVTDLTLLRSTPFVRFETLLSLSDVDFTRDAQTITDCGSLFFRYPLYGVVKGFHQGTEEIEFPGRDSSPDMFESGTHRHRQEIAAGK